MTEFAPPTPTLSFAFEARVLIGTPLDLGMVGGARKRIVPITGGRITGERFSGDVLPGGGVVLRFLAASINARAVVEIGTGAGFPLERQTKPHRCLVGLIGHLHRVPD